MTEPERGRPSEDRGAADSHAEHVLAQALRVMAGGGKDAGQPSGSSTSRARRLTTGQLILLAAIIGLLIGIGAGFISLML